MTSIIMALTNQLTLSLVLLHSLRSFSPPPMAIELSVQNECQDWKETLLNLFSSFPTEVGRVEVLEWYFQPANKYHLSNTHFTLYLVLTYFALCFTHCYLCLTINYI